MSCPSPTPPLHDPFDFEPDGELIGAPSTPIQDLQTPIAPDPLPKSDPDDNSPAEEAENDEEGEEIDEETRPASSSMDLRIDPPASPADVTLASPTARRVRKKRKKGKAKLSSKQLQAINEKLKVLRSNLNPIPFIPHKLLDFLHHEKLLKKLGLWEFVHIDFFERTIRVDPVAQLIANYNAKNRSSKVNGCPIKVNRADLARAFKLPLKKEKTNAGGGEVELDWEVSSDESVSFISGFVSEWMLLHEELWLMPNEVMEWMKLIKGGHPEKVDWAGLLWFMVEKELTQGGQGLLTDCYYASHLQHLIKCQREDALLIGEEPAKGEFELGIQAKEVEDVDNEKTVKESVAVESNVVGRGGDSAVVEGPSTELTLGQDGEKEGEVEEVGAKEVEMVDADSEKCKEEGAGGGEGDADAEAEAEGEEQDPWLLNGKNNLRDHFMQRCNSLENTDELGRSENTEDLGCSEERRDEDEEMYEEEDGEEDEEEARNNFSVFPDDGPLEGNFLQGMEASNMAYNSQEQLRNASSLDAMADVQHVDSTPSFFNNSGKRVIEHDYDHAVNDNNKRLRINETWDDKPQDLGMCFEQIVQMAQRARMLADEKEHAVQQSTMHQQFLLNEVQKRDNAIEHLHKVRLEETHKKDVEIGRLERELYLMGSVLDGYRKTLKEVKKAFAEYRERAQLPEESIYKDVGPGGLMLTAAEIERRRKKREEEFKMTCSLYEQKFREIGEEWFRKLDGYCDKTFLLETRFLNLKAKAEELIAMHSKRKTPAIEEKMPDDVESLPVLEPEEAVPEEVSEPLPFAEHEDYVLEAADNLPIPQSDADDLPIPQSDADDLPIPQSDADDLPIPQSDEDEIAAHTPPIE